MLETSCHGYLVLILFLSWDYEFTRKQNAWMRFKVPSL
jgi:hypothetical protein